MCQTLTRSNCKRLIQKFNIAYSKED
jgi:hypothetical protein